MSQAPGFVHLHVHTQYSLLEGAIHLDPLFERVRQYGMPAIAITDSSNLFGVVDFYLKAKKAKIKPILGCEIPFYQASRYYHLVLLCKNLQGYRNLCQIVTRAYTEAPRTQKARVDRELLQRYSEGLIVLSGCLRGELSAKIIAGEEEIARESLLWFKERFGKDFFLELQDTGIPEQDVVNEVLFSWGKKYGVDCVATSDCHYLDSKDAEAHEILQCIEQGRNLDFDRPPSLVPAEFYLKPPALMRERFERFPGACDNTLKIADLCNVQFCFQDESGRAIYHLPNYRPEGISKETPFDLLAYLQEQATQGLQDRFSEHPVTDESIYWERLKSELAMIEKTGFVGYFLIVADFINWAKRQKIPVGPGRGSGAGSLVAYALKITDIDPIQFNLLFERFINPERISMPDFDVDFCQDRRDEVIEHVRNKYGAENVSQIITFGKLQTRAVLKDVGRVLGLSFAETDQLTKLVPDELHISIPEALEKEPRLREKCEQEPRIAKVIEYAQALEGLYRNAGIHAAGVIITEEPIVNYCPLYVGKDGAVVTQLDKDSAEAIGLIKFDFLGLKTLTVIDHAVQLINQQPGQAFDLKQMHYQDSRVFALISSGDTDGVFQVESSGMKDLCSGIQPSTLEDLTAINALYRPGPLGSGMVDDFIDRKHGRKSITYELDALAPILKDTYGVILYQEQVMQIARELAGYSLGQADLLRRAMGKKKPEEMAKHREIFVKGAESKGITASKAEGIFDLMAKFAEYGFNKSHSAAYGILTYQTAYLKTHFPAEFMAALMTTEMDNTDKLTKYMSDCRDHSLPVLPPDVNRSQRKFSVEKTVGPAIRFGLEAIKGVGGVAVDTILEARKEGGAFSGVLDFCRRVSPRKVNKKVLEALTIAGAFDAIAEVNRASIFSAIEALLEYASGEQEERELGQSSLFDSLHKEEIKLSTPVNGIFKNEPEWPRSRQLLQEKQVLGFYLSGHPMDAWQKITENWLGWNIEGTKRERSRSAKLKIRIAGLISDIREITTRKATRMAFAQLEDLTGKIELIVFPDAYSKLQTSLRQSSIDAEPVVISGQLETSEETPKIFIEGLELVSEAHHRRVNQVILKLNVGKVSADQLRELKQSLLQNRGKHPVKIEFVDVHFKTQLQLPKTVCVNATPQWLEAVNKIFGVEVVYLQ